MMEGKSLYYFSVDSKIRGKIYRLAQKKYFDFFIVFVIILSSVQLALDNPLNAPGGAENRLIFIIDIITTVVFIFEALVKIISYGFV